MNSVQNISGEEPSTRAAVGKKLSSMASTPQDMTPPSDLTNYPKATDQRGSWDTCCAWAQGVSGQSHMQTQSLPWAREGGFPPRKDQMELQGMGKDAQWTFLGLWGLRHICSFP